jgi:predicted DNA-binding protein (UPF0251 family)
MEALRLCDVDGMYQHDAAGQMGISRSAFQRTVATARSKIARALVEGLTLQIKGPR